MILVEVLGWILLAAFLGGAIGLAVTYEPLPAPPRALPAHTSPWVPPRVEAP